MIWSKKKVHQRDVKNWIIGRLNLCDRDKDALWNLDLEESGYTVWKKKKAKIHPWLRITLIFWALFFVLLLVCMPLNFMLTGSWGYNPEKRLFRFYTNWGEALGL